MNVTQGLFLLRSIGRRPFLLPSALRFGPVTMSASLEGKVRHLAFMKMYHPTAAMMTITAIKVPVNLKIC